MSITTFRQNSHDLLPTRIDGANKFFVHQEISAQAKATPNALAVASHTDHLTYRELDGRANAVAQQFRMLGIRTEDIVAVWLRRSPWILVSQLAALKAGAAYLPIDPTCPAERVRFMLQDCGAKAIVCDAAMADVLGQVPCAVLKVDTLAQSIRQIEPLDPTVPLTPGNLAYVIYTSGSTGVPKGAQVTHASLSNLVGWHNRAFSVTSADRGSQVAGLGFDATVGETWPYLAAGASLCLADDQTLLSPEHLQSWLVSHQITIGFVPTPLAERIIVLKWPERTRLRTLLTGGDTLHVHPIKELPFTVINNYGPTECGMVTTSGLVPPSDSTALPGIGAPIDNCQVYILDENMRPVATGERGELYVGGVNVGRGYCNRPELTRERFLPNPFLPGTTMYKTGDLGCYLPNGEIAFFGRIDNQVKIRGYRIELDEIAAVLNGHPAITASAVVARGEREERKLIAYIIPSGSLSRAELQEYLLKTLPDYMVPATFVLLETLPLTANGKVDSSALPEPTPENMLVDQASSASSEIEASLAQVVANLLHVPAVGPEDDFFLMGGHSLLGTQLIARIRDSFGVNIPLRTLFEQPTVRGLATEVERLLIEKIEAMPEEEARRELRKAESQRTAQSPAA